MIGRRLASEAAPYYFAYINRVSSDDPIRVIADQLQESLALFSEVSEDARAVYVTPSHQYPMGTTMGAMRRMVLLNWAARSGAWIIEDDYDSEYRFGSRPIASL